MRSGFCARDLCTDETRGPTHDRCRMQACSCRHHDDDVKAKAAALMDAAIPTADELVTAAMGMLGEPAPRPLWDATAEIAYAALRLSGEAKVISDMSAEESMRVLYGLRDALDNLRDVEAALVQRVYLAGEHGQVNIEGLPPAKVQRARDRKNWDSRTAVFDYVSHRVERFAEEREGEFPPVAEIVSMALDVAGVTYCRTTALKAVGLDPEAYCDSSPGRISVTFTD